MGDFCVLLTCLHGGKGNVCFFKENLRSHEKLLFCLGLITEKENCLAAINAFVAINAPDIEEDALFFSDIPFTFV